MLLSRLRKRAAYHAMPWRGASLRGVLAHFDEKLRFTVCIADLSVKLVLRKMRPHSRMLFKASRSPRIDIFLICA